MGQTQKEKKKKKRERKLFFSWMDGYVQTFELVSRSRLLSSFGDGDIRIDLFEIGTADKVIHAIRHNR